MLNIQRHVQRMASRVVCGFARTAVLASFPFFISFSAPLQAWTTTTVAGGPVGYGSNVEQYRIGILTHAVADGRGSVFISDTANDRILKLNLATNQLSVAAGLGVKGFFGDGLNAQFALLDYPTSLAVDTAGNLYISDTGNRRVRKIDASTGNISTIAGTGARLSAGNGGAATAASLKRPAGLAVDAAGNVYIADSEAQNIRKITAATGLISNYAGNGLRGFAGDGGPATSARFDVPTGLAIRSDGSLFVADTASHRIRRVAPNGTIETFAGNGIKGTAGTGGPATSMNLNAPAGVFVAPSGTVVVADTGNSRIISITAGTATITAGTGTRGYSGDGSAATSAKLRLPGGVFVTAEGHVLIADTVNQRVRQVDATTGVISSLVSSQSSSVSNAPFVAGQMVAPTGVAIDGAGNIYVADPEAHVVHRIAAAGGAVTLVAGSGVEGFSGDGGVASAATLSRPTSVTLDAQGNLYISDTGNHRIRRVLAADNVISTIAGDGAAGFAGDGGPATAASLAHPTSIALGPTGDLYVTDTLNHRIRRINAATNVIQTIAGTGTPGMAGDGGSALSATLDRPVGIAVDSSGNVYIGNSLSSAWAIRKISVATGNITSLGLFTDMQTSAQNSPGGLSIAPDGTLYIVFMNSGTIGRLRPSLTPPTYVGGSPSPGFAGDNGAASGAKFNRPSGIAVDASGNIFIADTLNRAVRKLTPSVPSAPTGVTVAYNKQSATVSFSPGADNGMPIIDHTLDCGSQSVTVTQSPAILTGLTRGQSYSCSLRSRTSVGTGPATGLTVNSPVTPPDVPVIGTADILGNQYRITFSPPADNGGVAVTSYSVTASYSSTSITFTGFAGSPALITPTAGMLGVPVNFSVRAFNALGASLPSGNSNSLTLILPPGSPSSPIATKGSQSIAVSFSAPSSNGGSSILEYSVTCTSTSPPASFSASGTFSPITVTGIANGATYQCSVAARNSVGWGTPSSLTSPVSFKMAQVVDLVVPASLPYSSTPYNVTVSGGASGNPVVVTTQTASVCTSGGTNGLSITPVGIGTCQLRATQAGNESYDAGEITRSFSVVKGSQSISFPAIANRPAIAESFLPPVTGGASGTAVVLTSLTTTICTVSPGDGRTVNIVGTVGTCTLVANQAGNANYEPASAVQQSFQVYARQAQVINFPAIANRPALAASFMPPVTGGGSGIAVVLTSLMTTICTVSPGDGRTVNIVGTVGTCTLVANQAGNANYEPASAVQQSFQVYARQSQVITFATLPDRDLGTGPYTLSATGGASGNPVTFSSMTSSVCTTGGTNGSQLMLVQVGLCTVRAQQIGNPDYLDAPAVDRSFQVVAASSARNCPQCLNADNTSDLFWRNTADGSIQGWLMNGLAATQVSGLIPAGSYQLMQVVDLNGDGKADTVIRESNGNMILWLHDGLNVVAQNALFPSGMQGVGWNETVMHAADLNGDGRSDFILQRDDGAVVIRLMNGLNSTGAATLVPAGSGWSVTRVGDLNGDGKADLIWQHTSGTVQAWLMDGLSATQTATFVGAGSGWSVKLVADLNGDGKGDLVWQNADGTVQAWLMNGLSITQIASFVPAGTGWSPVLAGDIDGDGKADLFWEHTDGRSQTWLMNGLSVTGIAGFVGAGSWRATHLLDLNGDGKKDVLWKHADGTVQGWLLNGLTITQIASLAGAGTYEVIPPRN